MQITGVWTATPESVPAARAWTRHALTGAMPADVIDDAALVVTELAANVLEHTASAVFEVHLDCCPIACVVAVSDQGGRSVPAPRSADEESAGGRGLAMVEALADRLDVAGDVDGRTVSAVLPVAAPALERGAA